MSAKFLHELADDNSNLKKQIGCMTGIFQLFDRHNILTGRRLTGHSHKRLPSGISHIKNGSFRVEPNNDYLQTHTEKDSNKNTNENQRVSIESSRASFSSSSCSSSLSSMDCNRAAQLEHPSFDRSIFPETPQREPTSIEPNASPQLRSQPIDFRDVVKDSIYREPRSLSVKTTTEEGTVSRTVKHRDSPRPLQLTGSYGVGTNGNQKVPVDFNESVRVLVKLREAPRYFNEVKESPRSSYEAKEGPLFLASKDSPRFSYDGREIPRASFESRDTFKSSAKLRDLPRLSLDSREGSMRSSNSNSKSNSILKDLQRGSSDSNSRATNSQKELGTCKRPPSVVAKLMGLEALPNSTPATDDQMTLIKTCYVEDRESFTGSLRTVDESKPFRFSGSPRSSLKDPNSPKLKSPDLVMKPFSSSRFPIEPAPWRQPDGCSSLQKAALRNWEVPARTSNSSPSVYVEIEKRLKELKFKQSDKDLRALKQILEAMQAKGLLEAEKEEHQATKLVSKREYNNQNLTNFNENLRLANRREPQVNHSTYVTIKGTSPSRNFESPIVIMKPARLINKSGIPASSVIPIDGLSGIHRSSDSLDKKRGTLNSRVAKDLPPKQNLRDPTSRTLSPIDKRTNGRNLRSTQISTNPQQRFRENNDISGKNSGSVSPRLQQKRFELEKQSPRPPMPSSDATRPRRRPVRQPTESGSPGGKLRQGPSNLQQSDDQLSDISSETRHFSHQRDEISQQSDGNVSLSSQMDIEVTSADRSADINCNFLGQGSQSPSRNVANNSVSSLKQKKSSGRLSEDGPLAELATVAPEQPSPVSVLDASFYRDDLPSPVKKISTSFTDDETKHSEDNPGEGEWDPVQLDLSSDNLVHNPSSEINRKKLKNIEHLVQKLAQLNSNHNEATTDYIASLCENANPDHRYISEILLTSGLLLRDLTSGLTTFQLHPSGHPINPDLFFVLEQTKGTNEHNLEKVGRCKPSREKLHRKLMFDTVNEILVKKLPPSEPWLRDNKVGRRTQNAQQLLRELCSEVEQFQANNLVCKYDDNDDNLKSILWEDVMHRSDNWSDLRSEVAGVVLDVERLLFKDLVDEVVGGEAASLRAKISRRCR
ncbi:PREDICTED: protein LONGIFOLIA 1-like [Nelumbo nucifera]|uniref:Protein LONGIFOLIA 1-like n=1 Tax=Nelumbo nucifera TaxID=4432 RepID=A0A1U8ADD4_NELNU|nr:PREDICTED: protein LONGIFOLIA 1-like [Nelumbo nucifera]